MSVLVQDVVEEVDGVALVVISVAIAHVPFPFFQALQLFSHHKHRVLHGVVEGVRHAVVRIPVQRRLEPERLLKILRQDRLFVVLLPRVHQIEVAPVMSFGAIRL